MGWKEAWKGFREGLDKTQGKNGVPTKKPESSYQHSAYRPGWSPVYDGEFDGEKTPGELGNVYRLSADYRALRLRAYEADLTNDVISIITGKFFKWVIGTGLKTQSEPNEEALKTEGINSIPKNFRKSVESRFDVFAKNTRCDFKSEQNLHNLAVEAFKMAFHSDVLIIHRVKNGWPNVQIVDGDHVETPFLDDANDWNKKAEEKGHFIRNGIEMDENGKHIAYYVRSIKGGELDFSFERVSVYGESSGRRMAWLYGLKKFRYDNDRHIPMITPVLEKTAKLDRYTEATVGSAEERAKIVLAVNHNQHSTGENPYADSMRAAAGLGRNASPETSGYELGDKTAKQIAVSTGKQVFNMPIGAELKALYSQNEIQYDAFWKAIFRSLCAAVDIPPEVALQEYNSNYSASRAAIGGWEYIVKIYREKFSQIFYKPFYELWLHTEVLRQKIDAPGYLANSTNFMVTDAYTKARFTGVNMPHIDPVKEVKAVVEMMNNGLISAESATERVQGGDYYENQEKIKREEQAAGKDSKKEADSEGVELKKVANGED